MLLTSFVLALGNVVVMWLLSGRSSRSGWWLSLFMQLPWSVYDVMTRQYGFLIMSVLFSVSAIRGLTCKKTDSPPVSVPKIVRAPGIGREYFDGPYTGDYKPFGNKPSHPETG